MRKNIVPSFLCHTIWVNQVVNIHLYILHIYYVSKKGWITRWKYQQSDIISHYIKRQIYLSLYLCSDSMVLKSIHSVSNLLLQQQQSRRDGPVESNFDSAMRRPHSLTSCGPSEPHLHFNQTYYSRPPTRSQSTQSFPDLLSQRLDAYYYIASLLKLQAVILGLMFKDSWEGDAWCSFLLQIHFTLG